MSAWTMTKEQVPNFLRGLDRARIPGRPVLPPRSPSADILGAGLHTGVRSHSPDFQSWLTEFVSDAAVRETLCLELDILQAIHPRDPIPIDLSAQDFVDSPLWRYLLKFKDCGFRGRVFDLESQCFRLFATSGEMGQSRDLALVVGWHRYGNASALFRAIAIDPDLPEANRYLEASRVAAFMNCPNLMTALTDSPADYLRQDASNFYGILDGETALHHAARALSEKALMRLLEILGSEAFTAVDKNGNTFFHALACSKGPAARQLDLLRAITEFFLTLEPDVAKQAAFYQHKNKFGDTALNVAANRGNKELVTELIFVLGANAEAKSQTHPKGIDFGALDIHYGTLLAQKQATSIVKTRVLETSVSSLREERDDDREAMRAMVVELEDSRRERALLADELARSAQRQLMLENVLAAHMQLMAMLCGDLTQHRGLLRPETAALLSSTPFLVLGDAPRAGAGEEAEPVGEV